MSDLSRVTVVIPAYKAEATIRRAVDSVLAQPAVDVEIVVVIDGTLDNTAEQLNGYDPSRVKVLVNSQNRGAQISRNRGLAAARGEFLLFLDCDDFIEGPLLVGLTEKLQAEQADIAFGPLQVLNLPSGRRGKLISRYYKSPDDIFCRWMAHGETLSPCSIMWRTAFLRTIGGWNERIRRNQDGELVMRSILNGARFIHSTQGCGVYVAHDSPDRVTLRPENLPSMLDVGEELLAFPSNGIGDTAKNNGLAGYFHRVGLRLYASGRTDLGDRAVRRAKDLKLDLEPLRWHRLCAKLIGVPFRLRLMRMDQGGRLVWFLLGMTAVVVRHSSSQNRLRMR